MRTFYDLRGVRFFRLLVLRLDHRDYRCGDMWACLCDCGNVIVVSCGRLRHRCVRSCGCLRDEINAKRMRDDPIGITHGQAYSPEYSSWKNMKTRCTNRRSPNWKWYGGIGVKVCKRWLKFENFLVDMGQRPKGTSLHRRRDKGNYEPGNCVWATLKDGAAERGLK